MTLLDAFSDFEEFRADNHRYPLPHLVFIAVCMILCGADDWKMVSKLGKRKRSWLKQYIPSPHGVPSHHTFIRVFAVLDPEQFRERFIKWINSIVERTHGEVVALDGKTLRRSYDKGDDKAAIHMVSAWASETGIVLGQLKTAAKSNEITAITALLDVLEISGCIVTADAMGCQRAIAGKIRSKGADYLLAVKGNQGTLHEDIQLFLDHLSLQQKLPEAADYHETLDKGHGRLEIRRCWISTDIQWLEQRKDWKDLGMIGVVESERHEDSGKSIERRYFIASLTCDAMTFMSAVRAHWSVENNLHWQLDISFREDECRIRKGHGAENMAIFRHIALSLLAQEKTEKLGMKNKRITAAADNEYLELVLQGSI